MNKTETNFLSQLYRWLKYPFVIAVIVAGVMYVRTQAVPVESYVVGSEAVVRSVMGTGTLEARIRTTVSPKIPGRIAEVLVDQGAMVKAGQVLVRLDDEDLIQQVRIASAGISSSEATLGRFRAEVAQAKTTFTKNEAEIARYQKLSIEKLISQSEIDFAKEAYDLAKSSLLKAEANLLEAEHHVKLNHETLKYQEARLADTKLLAPFDGLVIQRERDPGAIVVPGSPILQLISLDELWISAWVDETEMDELRVEQMARIVFRSQPNETFHGSVARFGKQVDRETREFLVDVRVLKLPSTWAIGQRAEVFIELDRKDSCIAIPLAFLLKRREESGVYVNEDGVAQWRPISIGLEGRDYAEVVSGIEAGKEIIRPVNPNTQLNSGRKVHKQ